MITFSRVGRRCSVLFEISLSVEETRCMFLRKLAVVDNDGDQVPPPITEPSALNPVIYKGDRATKLFSEGHKRRPPVGGVRTYLVRSSAADHR